MVNFFRKHFIKNYNDITDPKVRENHGLLASIVGIISNFLLFLVKLLAGIFSNSISILADSINNLSDMSSCIATTIGFKMASRPADRKHPFGHERIEYIVGLIISIIVIFVGGSLFISSIEKIIENPSSNVSNVIRYITIGILVLSILVKLWMAYFYKKLSKIIDSVALDASSKDSRNDCISTSAILLGTIITLIWPNIPVSIDGILGVLVSIFIVVSGFFMIKETTDPLIGEAVDYDFVKEIVNYITSYDGVLGIHDLMCHRYGPTKCFMTVHVEVDSRNDIIKSHELIDTIELNVKKKFGVELTIHMDPLVLDDGDINELKVKLKYILDNIDSNLTFHDLRMIKRDFNNTILFDIVVPYNFKYSNEEIQKMIEEKLICNYKYNLIIGFDHKYIE